MVKTSEVFGQTFNPPLVPQVGAEWWEADPRILGSVVVSGEKAEIRVALPGPRGAVRRAEHLLRLAGAGEGEWMKFPPGASWRELAYGFARGFALRVVPAGLLTTPIDPPVKGVIVVVGDRAKEGPEYPGQSVIKQMTDWWGYIPSGWERYNRNCLEGVPLGAILWVLGMDLRPLPEGWKVHSPAPRGVLGSLRAEDGSSEALEIDGIPYPWFPARGSGRIRRRVVWRWEFEDVGVRVL